ncbi:MAG: hypothetical protein U5K00_14235 [Melioribacteraceae bacterium]|nr:hypothetical protein [Melioribacteraceae bacterium]
MPNKNDIIKKVNKLLIEHFGIPKRNAKLPNPVDMLIATILSQNTNDNNSYKAFRQLREKFDTWKDVANARRTSIESAIKVARTWQTEICCNKKLFDRYSKEER